LKNEIKKITKIIDEVINYFMFHYKPFVAMTIDCKGDTFFISFVFKDLKLSDEEFKAEISEAFDEWLGKTKQSIL